MSCEASRHFNNEENGIEYGRIAEKEDGNELK